ncbi:DNA cytosine methyltransferase [Calothrix sp. UHCC 0171]|uniref:DNA cytosine methyltransferase n=1 Tax=Calothrix sp. UHCC 0171 TaxID=3110245 RepID=UPI002B2166E7|nr:DNA cytosine methyltransferase [Calothrix sp. UHCC 0171]MEA5573636.1 DNA cytosine methyltransferase [Calothrix sp. UHCC 0171]
MNKKQRPIGIDLFAGAGGMSLGFEQAGFDVLAAVEIDPIHCAIHEFNFPLTSIFCKSIAEIKGEEIRNNSAIGKREIDVVFGGSPCQGFSMIGKRALDDPRNTLVFHFLRLILELQPKYFVFENVPGLTIGKHQNFLIEIIDEFRKCNYEVEEKYCVLNASNFGVPQDRARLFIIGCQQGLTLPKYPQAFTKPPLARNSKYIVNSPNLANCPTVWDAIGDLPEIENYPELFKRDWVIAKYNKPSKYGSILRGILEMEDNYAYERIAPPLEKSIVASEVDGVNDSGILTCSTRTKHNSESITRFQQTKPGETESISHFHRLDYKSICNTLRAGTASNRGAFTSPRPIHPFVPRCITVREAARLHSYPDWFRFHITKWHGFRQIGNSVPPLLAKAVASAIIHALGINPVKPKNKINLVSANLLQFNMSQAADYYAVPAHTIEPRVRQNKNISMVDNIKIIDEKHYKLVSADAISEKELQDYKNR